MVERILSENTLSKYDRSAESRNGTGMDIAADERVAEEFRREFLEGQRLEQTRAGQGGGAVKKKEVDEKGKGPRLGGSRSARAAMQASMQGSGKK
jgi:hypothetical protein